MVLSHQGKKEFASPVEPMTAEAVVLHFIDDLDSKLNQLRASREATPGMVYHRGMGRYVYLPALPEPEEPIVEVAVLSLEGDCEMEPVTEEVVQTPLFSPADR
jgi:3'-5' exoribonuclease